MKGWTDLNWQRIWGMVPSISFDWPIALWALLLVPLLILAYILLLRRRRAAFKYPNLALIKQAAQGPSWRRHIPPALMLLAFTCLLLAMARPTAEVSLPSRVATVMLVMDVSGSMRATTSIPRASWRQRFAAKAYVKDQPRDVRIGIVAFAATALLVQSPTTDHTALNTAIDRFELQRAPRWEAAFWWRCPPCFRRTTSPSTSSTPEFRRLWPLGQQRLPKSLWRGGLGRPRQGAAQKAYSGGAGLLQERRGDPAQRRSDQCRL
jgi:hypothetical protein